MTSRKNGGPQESGVTAETAKMTETPEKQAQSPAPAALTSAETQVDQKLKSSRRKIMTGLVLGVLLAALDQTVVGTSLPRVVADIGGFELFAWVFTAYLLAATCMIPLAGKFSDLFGRRPVYLLAMVLFLAGSVLCGMAQDMTQLILFRGVQGLGGGMLFPVAAATIADLYSPAERGKLQGALGAVFGFASVIGPFVGGWIVDYVHVWDIPSWRWVFYVNLPMGAIALLAVSAYFPKVERGERPHIDMAGIGLMMLALVSLVLVTVWGGETYAWNSIQIFGLAALSLMAFALFICVELRAKDPMIPPDLFKERIFALSAASMGMTAFGLFAVISFLPTYMQGVVGLSATYSGAVLLPLTFTTLVASAVSGLLFAKVGYKVFILGGSVISLTGLLMLANLGTSPPVWQAVLLMMYLGIGFGLAMPSYVIAVQNAIDKKRMGAATSTLILFRSLGVTIGGTFLGTLLNQRLAEELPSHVAPSFVSGLMSSPFVDGHIQRIPSLLMRPELTGSLPPSVIEGIKTAFFDSLSWLFLISAAVCALVLVIGLFIEDRKLKSDAEYHKGGERK